MSEYTKRKYVQLESLRKDFELPKENQSVVKILASRGRHLHEVTTPSGEIYLVSMPVKFRNKIFARNGSYVLIEPIAEGKKVKGEIVQILNKTSIKNYKENHVWPPEFEEAVEKSDTNVINTNVSTNESNDDDLFVNTNYKRPAVIYITDDSSDSDSDDSDSDKNE
ncbi:unnamed protein product [Arctia plantaginis]|nr:unnamed protein product [Arctia plantaginis]